MPENPRPPSWLLLLLYFAAVAAGGAMLAPRLFALGHWYVEFAARHGWHDLPLAGALAAEAEKADFQRYFNRAVLLSALGFLWPVLHILKLRRNELPGMIPDGLALRDAACGFLLAGGILLAMGWLLLAAGVFAPNPKASWPALLATAGLAAAVVALLEEFLLRGAFTAIAGRALSPRATLVFIALLFTTLHFMHPPEDLRIPDDAVGPWSGFRLAAIMCAQVLSFKAFTGGFLTLLAVALMLGWARLATRGLWLGIGLHAGWVFALKAFSAATWRAKAPPEFFSDLVIGDDLKTGLLPLAFLVLTALGLALYLKRAAATRPSPAIPRPPPVK